MKVTIKQKDKEITELKKVSYPTYVICVRSDCIHRQIPILAHFL